MIELCQRIRTGIAVSVFEDARMQRTGVMLSQPYGPHDMATWYVVCLSPPSDALCLSPCSQGYDINEYQSVGEFRRLDELQSLGKIPQPDLLHVDLGLPSIRQANC